MPGASISLRPRIPVAMLPLLYVVAADELVEGILQSEEFLTVVLKVLFASVIEELSPIGELALIERLNNEELGERDKLFVPLRLDKGEKLRNNTFPSPIAVAEPVAKGEIGRGGSGLVGRGLDERE